MRNSISMASSTNTMGSGASDHHSGVTNVLMFSAPLAKLAHAACVPYQAMKRQQARPIVSPTHSRCQARRLGMACSRMSTRMCWPWRSSQGATHIVSRYSISSEISLLQASPRGMPGTAMLRSVTSATISSIMANRMAQPASARPASSLP